MAAVHDPAGCLAKPAGAGSHGPDSRWQLLHDASGHGAAALGPDGGMGRAVHLPAQEKQWTTSEYSSPGLCWLLGNTVNLQLQKEAEAGCTAASLGAAS